MNNNLLIVPSETDKTLIMVPVQAVKQDLITKTDYLIYVPLASKETFGTVKIGEGLSITKGVLSIDPLGVDLQSKVDKFQGKEKYKQSLIIDAEGYVTTGYAKGSIDIYQTASLRTEDAGYLRFSDDFEVFSTEDEGALVSFRIPVPEKTSQLFNDGDGKSSFATIDYVNVNGGKIDIIKVNNVPQEIVDKTIELTIPSIEGLASETLVNTKAQEVLTTANKHTDDRISDLIGQAPETLDTLKEIADALAEDQTVLDTLNLAIGNKVNKTLKINGKTLEQDINLTAADVGALSSFTETDPTVPDWAKAATKPSYNYSEINNTPTIPTVNNSTITIKQGEETKGTFTLNQTEDKTIELDVGGGGSTVTLYEELGQNTDGALTQKKSTEELNKKVEFTDEGFTENLPTIQTQIDSLNSEIENLRKLLSVSSLPLGTIISSAIMQGSSSLHLLDGGELSIGGTYDAFCQFVIEAYNRDNTSIPVTDLETYQSELNTYGQCGKFVITDTYIKLPTITKYIEGISSISDLGRSLEAGLPNITGTFSGTLAGGDGGAGTNNGAFALNGNAGSNSWGGNSGWDNAMQVTFNASRSSTVYGKSTTVQPKAIKYPYYIVIATVAKTDIEVNIDNVASDLNDKLSKTECVRYLVSKWQSSDGLSWYTIYNDGWKECGVYDQTSYTNSGRTITLPITFSTQSFTVCATPYHSSYVSAPLAIKAQTYNSVTAVCTQTTQRTYIYCCGY